MMTAMGIVIASLAYQPPAEAPFENESLWQWHLPPVEVRIETNASTVVNSDEQMVMAILCTLDGVTAPPQVLTVAGRIPVVVCGSVVDTQFRIVGFDEQRHRLPNEGSASCGVRGGSMGIASLKVGPSRFKYLGVEKLTPEAQRRRGSEAAKALAARGVTLSFPVEGEPYRYRFPGVDSTSYAGDVVLIQWWASW